MNVTNGSLAGTLVFTPTPHVDERGYFTRTFDADLAAEHGVDGRAFVQDSQSRSHHGVLRGLHFRTDGQEAKLVRCARGRIFDVAVDLRPWSPTFAEVQCIELNDERHETVYLPPGIAHGWQALTELVDVCYRMDAVHRPEAGATLAFDDPRLAISWPLPPTQVSDGDRNAPGWDALAPQFAEWFALPDRATAGAR